jgi:hypothetical protein
MKTMQKPYHILMLTLLILLIPFSSILAETAQQKGRKIMEKIDSLPVLEKVLNQISLFIYDAQGKVIFTKKVRGAQYYSDYQSATIRLIHTMSSFYAPADDKGNGSLIVEVANDDDDQWIYLKGLRKPKRIIGSDKSSSFMGSDMSNGDIAPKNIDDSNYIWLGSYTVLYKNKKISVEKVQAAFKKKQMQQDYGRSKAVIWVHVKSGLVFKSEQYDLDNQLYKTTRLLSFKVFKNKDKKSVFIMTGSEAKSVLKGTKTVMKMTNIKTGKAAKTVRKEIFKTSFLTRRWW